MPTPPLSWGLLGTARINRAIIPAIRAAARSRLEAVASRDAGQAAAYAAEWQIPRAVVGYEALVADPGIDAVYIPLPNHLHAEWAVRAAAAGKHVLCEKPLALAPAECDAIAEAAARAGVVVAEAFMYRHHPQTLTLERLLAEGRIGALQTVRSSFTFTLTRAQDVRLTPAFGGGSLWDVGCYPVSAARLFAGGNPVEVFGWQRPGPTGIDLQFAGQLRFASGVLAQIDCGFDSPFRTHLELVGTEGTLTVARPFKPAEREQIELRRGDAVEAVDAPAQVLYVGEVEDLEAAVFEGRAPRVTLDDSRGNVATLVALHASAREGRPVAVERGE